MKYILEQKNSAVDTQAAHSLAEQLKIKPILAQILCGRGLNTLDLAKDFLYPTKSQLFDPFLFDDMADSVSMIKHTIANNGKIALYGDYDVDGTAGCAILYQTLKQMNANVDCHLPSRLEHGYGLSLDAVEQMRGYSLLITIDCGITNIAEIEKAKELGLGTIVTDHHECGHVLPNADCILNAKRPGESYPYKDLCGAGVAFKLACALCGEDAFAQIDLAALATIADIVPMLGENRVIAKLGLDKMNKAPNRGLAWLVKKIGPRSEAIDSQMVSFSLAPRINAAGRIASARTAFLLMVEQDDSELEQLADELCSLNAERQFRQEEIFNQALEMEQETGSDRIILLYKPEWDVGIIGLAASKISEKYCKPAVLFGKVGDSYVGSARSISGVNIYEALASQADLYEKFGGHSGAAGLTILEEHLGTLKNRLNLYLNDQYSEESFKPVRLYDIELTPQKITANLVADLERLNPVGHKNEPVEILIRNARLANCKPIGDNKHVRFSVVKQKHSLNAVAFGRQAAKLPDSADVVGIVRVNTFDKQLQMVVDTLSFQPSLTLQYEESRELLAQQATGRNSEKYFCDRQKLLEIFTILKRMHDKGMQFKNMEHLLQFLIKHVEGIDANKSAFAFAVLEQIELLEIKKGDRIHIVVYSGRRDLENSALYQSMLDIDA